MARSRLSQELLRRRRELLRLVSVQHFDYIVQLALESQDLPASVVNLICALVLRPVAPPQAFIANFDTREGALRADCLSHHSSADSLVCVG